MRKPQLAGAVAATLILTACGSDRPTAQGPAPVVDQAFEPGSPDAVVGIGNVGAYAQTFVAGLTGTLTSVDLILSAQALDDTIRVDLRGTSGGNPTLDDAVVMGSRLVAASKLPAYPSVAFVTVNLANLGIQVIAGDSLAVVLTRTAGSGPADVLWYSDNSLAEDYAGGTSMQRNGGSGTAWMSGLRDFYFRTRVLVP